MSGVATAYRALVDAGELRPDPEQAAAAEKLYALRMTLATAARPGLVGRLFGAKPPPPRGIYLWGGVGRGKSMLMDLFYARATVQPRRRVHFHEFMLEIHAAIHAHRQVSGDDPIPVVAARVAAEAKLLCFDELQVRDVADAAIVSRLFTGLFDAGTVIVATSNRPPRDLYKDGLNRALFLPFIDLIEARMEIVPLNGPVDYRLDRLGGAPTWYVPNGPAATAALSAAFFRLTDFPVEDRVRVPSETIAVPGGRTLVRAQGGQGRRGVFVQPPVPGGIGGGGLSRGRAAVPYGDPRRHSADGAGKPQRGGALRHADRRTVRAPRQAARRRRRRTRRAVPGGRRRVRVRADRVAVAGNAVGGVSCARTRQRHLTRRRSCTTTR